MNPETLTTIAENITSTEQILNAIAQILPYARRFITMMIKTIKALHNLMPRPGGRHRQGRARHTK